MVTVDYLVDHPVDYPVDHFNKTVKKSFREIFKKFLQEEQLKRIFEKKSYKGLLGEFLAEILQGTP